MAKLYFIIAIILILLFHHFNSIFTEFLEFKKTVNESHYFDNLTKTDLYLRNSTLYEYRNKYINAYREFSLSQKIKIWKALLSIPRTKLNRITDIRGWNIVLLEKNMEIEYGLPHTIGDIIILRDLEELPDILLHELVHIYQRYYKPDSELLLNLLGFIRGKPIDERELYNYGIYVKLLSNPDSYNDYYYKGWLIKLIINPNIMNIMNIMNNINNISEIASDVLINIKTKEIIPFSNIFNYINQGQPHEIVAELITRHLLYDTEKSETISYWLNL